MNGIEGLIVLAAGIGAAWAAMQPEALGIGTARKAARCPCCGTPTEAAPCWLCGGQGRNRNGEPCPFCAGQGQGQTCPACHWVGEGR